MISALGRAKRLPAPERAERAHAGGRADANDRHRNCTHAVPANGHTVGIWSRTMPVLGSTRPHQIQLAPATTRLAWALTSSRNTNAVVQQAERCR